MASHSSSTPMEPTSIESAGIPELPADHLPLHHHETEEAYDSVEYATPASTGGFGSFVLSSTGFLLAAGGLALATAPHFSWQLTKVGRELASMGLESGTFVVGGLLLFGLGLVYRAVHAAASRTTPVRDEGMNELGLYVEDLATDLALLRESTMHVCSQVEGFGQHQEALHQELRAGHHHAAEAEGRGAVSQHEAMFRLAASLDQLNARIDERMHHMDVQLRGHFQGVGEAIRESRESMDEGMRALSSRIQARSVDHTLPERTGAPSLADLAESFDNGHGAGGDQGTEELEVLVELEDPYETERDESSQEFFDTLEQLDQLVSRVEHETPALALDFDGLDFGEFEGTTDAVGKTPEPPPVRPDPEPEYEDGDRLESLLPDDAVRRALDPEHRRDR